jgi:hypothetical protein
VTMSGAAAASKRYTDPIARFMLRHTSQNVKKCCALGWKPFGLLGGLGFWGGAVGFFSGDGVEVCFCYLQRAAEFRCNTNTASLQCATSTAPVMKYMMSE